MRNARRTLRCSTLWGMIPLALWASLPTTSCFCADGGFKLFCGGHMAGAMEADPSQSSPGSKSAESDAPVHCPACATKQLAAASDSQSDACDVAASNACCSEGQLPLNGSPTACCQLIESTTGTLTSVVSLPDHTAIGLTNVVDVVCAPRLTAAALAGAYDVFEIGPVVDRVIVHCSLLI